MVVVWGDREETKAALGSLVAMTRPPDVTYCVAQECSESFRRALAQVPGTEVVALEANVGFAAAANLGMELGLGAGCEWLMLLNNDATADAECLEACLAEATASPKIAVAGPAVRITDRPEELWFAGGVHSHRLAYTRHRGLGAAAAAPPPSSDTDYVSGCCAVVSAAAWREIGPFQEDYFLYYEDVEWCERARAAGWRCRYVGRTLCSHALGVSSGQRGSLGLSDATAYYLARNPLRFALDTPSPWLRATRVAGVLLIWGAYNARRLARARRWSTWRSYLQGLGDARAGRMGRRPVG